MQPQIRKKRRVWREGKGGGGGKWWFIFQKEKKRSFDVSEEWEDPGGRRPSDLQTEPRLGGRMQPLYGDNSGKEGGEGIGGGGSLSYECKPIASVQESWRNKRKKGWWRNDVPPG